MIKQLLLIGAVALLAAFNAQARIGYTAEECEKQYGHGRPEVSLLLDDDGQANRAAGFTFTEFYVGDLKITATFWHGKVYDMVYTRQSKDVEDGPGKFTGEEVKALYAKNGGKPNRIIVFGWGNELNAADIKEGLAELIEIVNPVAKAEVDAFLDKRAADKAANEKAAVKNAFDSL